MYDISLDGVADLVEHHLGDGGVALYGGHYHYRGEIDIADNPATGIPLLAWTSFDNSTASILPAP